ncbi:hypothetical protein JCM16303_000909 [Sporobolomyces ruberrimus]
MPHIQLKQFDTTVPDHSLSARDTKLFLGLATPLSPDARDSLYRRQTEFKARRNLSAKTRSIEMAFCGLVAFVFLVLVQSRVKERSDWRATLLHIYNTKKGVAYFRNTTRVLRLQTPQNTFRSNLRDDVNYITTFPYGGLTNQLLSTFKLTYMARRLGRAAILPDLEPNHAEGEYTFYSNFFDLDYFSHRTNVPLTEWKDVKKRRVHSLPSKKKETLGCWGEGRAPDPSLPDYETDVSFWPVPKQLATKFGVEPTTTFAGIETIDSHNATVTKWLDSKVKQWFRTIENSPPLPDQHLLCFRNLFYTSTVNTSSLEFVEGSKGRTPEVEGLGKDSDIWLEIGQYLKFTPRIESLVDDYLTSLIGDPDQPFIAVHIRQGDFLKLGRSTNETSTIKTKYSRGLELLHEKLEHLPALEGVELEDLPILLATDSTDPNLLAELKRMRWTLIDHEKIGTKEMYGGWYPGLLDSAILSRAIGLVGTKQSTFTYLAERRIESWNGGAGVVVEL